MRFNYKNNNFVSELKPLEILSELEHKVEVENVFKIWFSNYRLKVSKREDDEIKFKLIPNLTRRLLVCGIIKRRDEGSILEFYYFPSVLYLVPYGVIVLLILLFHTDTLIGKIIFVMALYFLISSVFSNNRDINKLTDIAKAEPIDFLKAMM